MLLTSCRNTSAGQISCSVAVVFHLSESTFMPAATFNLYNGHDVCKLSGQVSESLAIRYVHCIEADNALKLRI